MKSIGIEEAGAEALRSCLSGLPGAQVRMERDAQRGGRRWDLLARVRWLGRSYALVAVIRRQLHPQTARLAISELRAQVSAGLDAYPLLIAPFVSPATAAVCTAEQVGYADLAGNCRLAFGGIYIERRGQPNPARRRDELKSLFTPRAERVVRTLLAHPRRGWKLVDVASEAGVSLGHAHNVKRVLLQQELVDEAQDGLRLVQPAALLESWAAADRPPDQVVGAFSMDDLAEVEQRLSREGREPGRTYALTEFAAAIRYAPMVRHAWVSAYIAPPIEPWLEAVAARPVGSGANLRLILPRDEGVFYDVRDCDGVQVVTPVQAYVDLVRTGGRGEEAAAALRQKVIEPRW